ncbi:mCG1038756, partial [Mus musculus]
NPGGKSTWHIIPLSREVFVLDGHHQKEEEQHVTCGKNGTLQNFLPQQLNIILERAVCQFARIECIRFLTSNNRCSGYIS